MTRPNAFLGKPIDQDKLLVKIKSLLYPSKRSSSFTIRSKEDFGTQVNTHY